MWGWIKTFCIALFVCCFVSDEVFSQALSLKETIARHLFKRSFGFPTVNENFSLSHSLDYSLTTNLYFLVNWLHDNKLNQINLIQNLKYKWYLQNSDNIHLTNTFIHNLGIQHFFDSITTFNTDDNTLTSRVEIPLFKKFSLAFDSRISSRLMKGFDYIINDSGKHVRVLNSSFLTPLICTFSMGLGYNWPNTGFLNIGISAAKLTYIHNRQIFAIRGIRSYYGIEEGRSSLFEYGFTLQVLIDKDILNFLHWNFDLLVFKNYRTPPELAVKNLFDLRFSKYLKTSLQTRIFYEEKLSKRLQLENILSVGFNIQL